MRPDSLLNWSVVTPKSQWLKNTVGLLKAEMAMFDSLIRRLLLIQVQVEHWRLIVRRLLVHTQELQNNENIKVIRDSS